jgi:predicted AlkP superfamily phosphohydrolase/phosphomutase
MIMFIKKCIPEEIWDIWTRRYLNTGAMWQKSQAFDVPSDYTGAIRINLRGREPKGLVEPDEYNAIYNEIVQAFMELVNHETGEKIVEEVVHVREKYSGDGAHDLPDIAIRWVEQKPATKIQSDRIGIIDRDYLPDKRTGAHKDFGFFLIAGDGIQEKGRLREQMHNWDVAPTLLYLMGERVPEDMDGVVQLDILEQPEG